jgi:hypothetical protein
MKYLLIFLFLFSIGISVAYNFWWTDSVNLSYFGKEMAALLFSIGVCWFGVLYLSILISRKLTLKNDQYQFIGLLDIQPIEFISRNIIDIATQKKLSHALPFTAFPIMIVLVLTFILTMHKIEIFQLNKYGIIEHVEIKSSKYTIKNIPYNHIEYGNGKFSTNLSQEKYKVGDKVQIIYSRKNPQIVKYLDDFEKR